MTARCACTNERPRFNLDEWERMMIRRDFRLTGSKRGQGREAVAPEGFATNSFWSTEKIA